MTVGNRVARRRSATCGIRRQALAAGGAMALAALLSGCQAASPRDAPGSAAIVGLDRGAVRKLLGEPGLIRRETPAEVWQYRTAGCVLDVVLYDQASGPRVAYTEARTPAAEPAPTDNCLSDVLTTHQPTTS